LSGKKAAIDHVRNDINVTPLVDVMLVLLIIFMLMMLVMGRGAEVTVPKAKNFSEEKDRQQPVVTVAMDENSGAAVLYVEKENLGPIDPAHLKEMEIRIQTQWKAPGAFSGHIYLKAGIDVPYEKVYPVLEYMNKTMAVTEVDLAVSKGGN
jgi:biopolymer transport protein ExbD